MNQATGTPKHSAVRRASWRKHRQSLKGQISHQKAEYIYTRSEKGRAFQRARRLKVRYNLTVEEWENILKEQGGVCAGCKRPPSDFNHTFHVDHNHSTQAVRGILCWSCNQMLPTRKNLTDIIHNLMEYLDNPPATRALGGERFCPKKKRKRWAEKSFILAVAWMGIENPRQSPPFSKSRVTY